MYLLKSWMQKGLELSLHNREQSKMFKEKEYYRSLCDGLYNDGVIKQDIDGVIIAVDDPVERESIRTKSKQKTHTQQ